MLLMLLLGPRIDQDTINKHDHQLIKHRSTHSVHAVHEHCWGIGEPKWHHHKLIVPIPSPKSCLQYILILNPHLMVSQPKINFGKPRHALQLIEQITDPC